MKESSALYYYLSQGYFIINNYMNKWFTWYTKIHSNLTYENPLTKILVHTELVGSSTFKNPVSIQSVGGRF